MKKHMIMNNGFTLIELIIVITVIGILSAMALPYWLKNVARSNSRACINNLRILEDAKQQFALDTKKAGLDTFSIQELTIYLRNPNGTTCPSTNATYLFGEGTISSTIVCPNYRPTDPEFSTHVLGSS